MSDDFYDLLDVPEDASQEDIKEAFREQVRIYHPDLNDDDRAQAQFTALKKAYDILGDPAERNAYDRLGHEEYVAKRTSGIPSPDLWQSGDDDSDEESTASSSTGGSGRSTTSAGSTTSTSKTTTGTASASTSASTSASSSTSSTTATSTGTSSSTDGGTATPSQPGGDAHAGGFTDNAVVRWWKRQNFGLPLVWTATLTYLIGLAHFAFENAGGLRELWTRLAAVGAEPNELWTTISSETHGIDTLSAFIVGVELVEPPLAPMQWYGLLAGVVALSLGIVAGNRVLRRHEALGSVSTDELMVLSLAIAVATVLVGGPLLVGIVLLPILFGVIVHRTRQLPGWNPSYAYVLAVCAPAVTLAAGWGGYGSLPADLVAFVIGLVGAIGFPLRALIRTRFGH